MKSRESSWSAINDEAEATEVVNNRPAGELVVDILTLMVLGKSDKLRYKILIKTIPYPLENNNYL